MRSAEASSGGTCVPRMESHFLGEHSEGSAEARLEVPRQTMRTQFRAGKIGMNVNYFLWLKVGGEREERDRIIPRLLPRASGYVVVLITEMGNFGRAALQVGRERDGDDTIVACAEF